MKKHGEVVKARILSEGVALLCDGMHCVTSRAIGRRLDMSHTAVLYHFDDAATLRDAVAFHAVEKDAREAIAHLLAMRHRSTDNLTDAERLTILSRA